MSETSNRHASNLELFLDLVFVFSVTQVTGFIAGDLSTGGVAKGALLGFLVWWQWTAFTWAGTAIDFQADTRARLIVLGMIPAMLVMAISVPYALDGQPWWFAIAYFVVQLFVLGLQASEAWEDPVRRKALLNYSPLAAVAPTVLLIGAAFDADVRHWVWLGAAAVMFASAMAASERRGGQWSIDATHFAERHALFVIITLGEVLVAIGATGSGVAAEHGLDGKVLAAIIVTSAVLWWCSFAYIPVVFERTLERTAGQGQGNVARDVGSFGHFPLVFGLICYAVVAKHVVAHPEGEMAEADRWLLAVAVWLFIGAQSAMQYRFVRQVARERIAMLAAAVLIPLVGGSIPAVVLIGAVAVVLGAMSVVLWRRFRASTIGQEVFSG